MEKGRKVPTLPGGTITVAKIIKCYKDLLGYVGAKILVFNIFFYEEYQEWWTKILYEKKEYWVSERFGLTIKEDMLLTELATAYAFDDMKDTRLRKIGENLIKNQGLDQKEAEEVAEGDAQTLSFIHSNAIKEKSADPDNPFDIMMEGKKK